MALGPLLECQETRFTDGMTVIHLVLFKQPVADQQRDTTLTDLDRRDHGDAPGAALTEASCTDSGCWFLGHVTVCYYGINRDFRAIPVGTFLFMGLQAIAARLIL